MVQGVADVTQEIARLKAARDELVDLVRRYDMAIGALEDGNPQLKFAKPAARSLPKRADRHKKNRNPEVRGRFTPPSIRKGAGRPRKPSSVRSLVREAVQSQTKPFTAAEVREHLCAAYPGLVEKLKGERMARELYYLRSVEKLFDIESEGEKGGAHVYKLKAA